MRGTVTREFIGRISEMNLSILFVSNYEFLIIKKTRTDGWQHCRFCNEMKFWNIFLKLNHLLTFRTVVLSDGTMQELWADLNFLAAPVVGTNWRAATPAEGALAKTWFSIMHSADTISPTDTTSDSQHKLFGWLNLSTILVDLYSILRNMTSSTTQSREQKTYLSITTLFSTTLLGSVVMLNA